MLSGTGDSQRDSRESFAIETPIFIAQRASNGGLDPWDVGSANLGRPIFASNLPENACFKGIWGDFEAKMGRPKFADPTPHGSNPPLKTL